MDKKHLYLVARRRSNEDFAAACDLMKEVYGAQFHKAANHEGVEPDMGHVYATRASVLLADMEALGVTRWVE